MKLTDIPVVFICPDHNEKYQFRKLHMFTLLHKIGFKNVSMFKSDTEKYPMCLVRATRDVLSNYIDDSPVLVLEDDVEITEWADFDMDIEIPSNTDAFYLGFSKYAALHTEHYNAGYWSVQVEHLDDRYIQIVNMLGAHAILYVSKRYKQVVHDIMDTFIRTNEHVTADVPVARIQKTFNIYGFKYPMFYQSDQLGNDWYAMDATNFRF